MDTFDEAESRINSKQHDGSNRKRVATFVAPDETTLEQRSHTVFDTRLHLIGAWVTRVPLENHRHTHRGSTSVSVVPIYAAHELSRRFYFASDACRPILLAPRRLKRSGAWEKSASTIISSHADMLQNEWSIVKRATMKLFHSYRIEF